MIKKIDHMVITTKDLQKCLEFYEKVGFIAKEANSRYELFAGDFKINVHILGKELSPHAQNVQTGSVDFCFETTSDIDLLKEDFISKNLEIELGVVQKTGVKGAMYSIYLRDPDGNLVEFCNYSKK